MLSKIYLRLKNFIVKQELEQNFKKENGEGKEGEEGEKRSERRERLTYGQEDAIYI